MKQLKQYNHHAESGAGKMTILDGNGRPINIQGDFEPDLLGDDLDEEGDFFGDDLDEHDVTGDLLFGDEEISDIEGDMFTGDPKTKWGQFLGRKGKWLAGGAAAVASIAAIKKAKGISRSRKQKLISKIQSKREINSSIIKIPGAVLSRKMLSPLIINNGMLNQLPTRGMVPGNSFFDTINRSETAYPGTTRTQVAPAAAGTQVFTFAAPAGAEGGNIQRVPVLFLQLSTQRQFSVSAAQIGIALTAINEAGNAVDARTWSVMLSSEIESCFIAVIPFTEISSVIVPNIVYASGANNLVMTVTGLPTNTNIRCILPGTDSSQYDAFKKGFGMAPQFDKMLKTY